MNRLRSIAVGFLLVVGIVVASRVVTTGVRLIRAPIETTGQEAAQPIIASAVSSGEPLYRDWRQPPHTLAIYGPLTYAVPASIARLRAATPWETWIIGRTVSVVAGVLALAMCVVLMRREGVRPSLIALGVLALIPVLSIWSVAFTFRADMGMIACGLAGLAVAGDWHGRWKWWSVPLFIAAIAYKQHGVAAPAAIFLFLILQRRRPEAARFAIVMAMAGIAYVASMQLITHGWFLSNAFGAASAAFSFENVTENLRRFFLAFPFIALPGLWLIARRMRHGQFDPVSLFFVVSFFIAAVLSGRTGSDVNYFIEGFIALGILSIVLAEEHLRAVSRNKPSAAALVAAAFVALCYIPMDRYPTAPALLLGADAYDDPAGRYRSALAPTNGAKVFSAELSAAVLADSPTFYSDGFIIDEMIASGRMSAESIVAEFRAQGYSYALVPDRVPEWQHVSVVPRPLLMELVARADRQSAVKVAELAGGRTLYLVPLSRRLTE